LGTINSSLISLNLLATHLEKLFKLQLVKAIGLNFRIVLAASCSIGIKVGREKINLKRSSPPYANL
jgi:hypothetical protein